MKLKSKFEGKDNPFHDSMPSIPLCILSGESVTARAPYSFHVLPTDSIMFLYTKNGSGRLTFYNESYTLKSGSLILFPCEKPFRIQVVSESWEYSVYFIAGTALSFFSELLQAPCITGPPLIALSVDTDLVRQIEKINAKMLANSAESQLSISELLYSILCKSIEILNGNQENDSFIPYYIKEIKRLFDHSFEHDYSLDYLEQQFHVNKYRLCKQFRDYCGEPPLMYLNGIRIRNAMHYLATTDRKVQQIGSMVGFDNTERFIHLFKKYTGVTPLTYRQKLR